MKNQKGFIKSLIRHPAFIVGSVVDLLILIVLLTLFNNNTLYILAAIFALGFLFIIWALLDTMKKTGILPRLAKIMKVLIIGCIVFMTFLFAYVEYLIITNSETATDNELSKCQYAIVLGCRVNGSTPSLMLQSRLESAYNFLNKNPFAKIVVSGGKGRDEDISEAEAMKRYLTGEGISEDRIIIEDKSTDTELNIKYSTAIIEKLSGDTNIDTAIITNDFHLYRSKFIAEDNGLRAHSVAASTPDYLRFNYYLREFFSVIFAWLKL